MDERRRNRLLVHLCRTSTVAAAVLVVGGVVGATFVMVLAYEGTSDRNLKFTSVLVGLTLIASLFGAPNVATTLRAWLLPAGEEIRDARERLTYAAVAAEDAGKVDLLRGMSGLLSDEDRLVVYLQPASMFAQLDTQDELEMAEIPQYFLGLKVRRRLVLVGEAGAGKSVISLLIGASMLSHAEGDVEKMLVPLRLDPERIPDVSTLEEWAVREMLLIVPGIKRRVVKELFGRGLVVPILDGLDELDADDNEPRLARRAVSLLNTFRAQGGPGPVVVTTRPDDSAGRLDGLGDATVLAVQPLRPAQLADFIATISKGQNPTEDDLDEEAAWLPVVTALRLGGDQAEQIMGVMGTPWHATLAMVSCSGANPSSILLAPGQGCDPTQIRERLIEAFVPASLDALRRRRAASNLSTHAVDAVIAGQPSKVLGVLAGQIPHEGGTSRGGGTVDPARWASRVLLGTGSEIAEHAGRRLARLHGALAGLVACCALALILGTVPHGYKQVETMLSYVPRLDRVSRVYAVALILGVVAVVTLPISAAFRCSRQQMEPTRLGVSTGSPTRTVATVLAFISFGAVTGLMLGETFASGGFATNPVVLRTVGSVAGAIAGLAAGVTLPGRRRRAIARRPSQVLQSDAVAAVAGAATIGSLAATGATIAAGLRFGVAMGVAFSLYFAFCVGPRTVWRYLLAVWLYHGRVGLPRRWMRFLDVCLDAGILRVIGASYQFRHNELMEWAAAQDAK